MNRVQRYGSRLLESGDLGNTACLIMSHLNARVYDLNVQGR